MVLFHESPLSSKAFEAALPLLGGRVRAFAFDTPGYGESDPPPAETEIPDYAATLLEAINALGIEQFAAFGVHTGASLALQVVLQAQSGRATHFLASGIPVFTAQERAQYLESWSPQVQPDADGTHLGWAWKRYQRIWNGPPQLLHDGATMLLSNLQRYHWAYNAAFRYDPEPDLPSITVPTLLLTAEHDLLIESDRRAVRLIPNARLQEVPDLVGQLPMRVPDQFATAICDFVR